MRGTVIVTAFMLCATVALAQPGRGPQGRGPAPPFDKFRRLSPKDRQRALQKLPPDRARQVQNRMDNLEQMTPAERERLEEQYEWFQQLPPERQNAMRKAFRRYSELPRDRQRVVHEEFQSLRAMTEAERTRRFEATEFRSRFNADERTLLQEMTGDVPD